MCVYNANLSLFVLYKRKVGLELSVMEFKMIPPRTKNGEGYPLVLVSESIAGGSEVVAVH
jgi:hypothetical protein